jgi:hypothetical protein
MSYYPGICLEALRKTTKTSFRITGLLYETQKEYLNNTHVGEILLQNVTRQGMPFY